MADMHGFYMYNVKAINSNRNQNVLLQTCTCLHVRIINPTINVRMFRYLRPQQLSSDCHRYPYQRRQWGGYFPCTWLWR